MNIVSVTDKHQYRFVFPNILSLEKLKCSVDYYIFTSCSYTHLCLLEALNKITTKYVKVHCKIISSFFEYFDFKSLTGNHPWITTATLDRLILPYISNLDKFIYLDTDTLIVNNNIFDYYEYTSPKGISAVPNSTDIFTHIIEFSNAEYLLPLAKTNFTTFNAGIMIVDCKKNKDNNLENFIREVYNFCDNDQYINDELILNLFDPNYYKLPLNLNAKPYESLEYDNPSIVHFSGKEYKPWNSAVKCTNNLKRYYGLWNYYYYTVFKEYN